MKTIRSLHVTFAENGIVIQVVSTENECEVFVYKDYREALAKIHDCVYLNCSPLEKPAVKDICS